MSLLGKVVAAALLIAVVLAAISCNPALNAEALPTLAQQAASPTAEVVPSHTAAPATPAPLRIPSPTPLPTDNPAPSPTSSLTPTPVPTPTPAGCVSAGRVVTGTYPSLIDGPTRNYRIYLPPCYGEDGRAYPTLYVFHGSIQDDSTWDALGLDETAEEAIAAGKIPPLLIVMPDGGWAAQHTSGGPGSFEGIVLNELIPYIEANYCAWPDAAGRAVGGLSRGGYWALEIAFRHPELFVSVGGHSAALLDIAAGPSVNPQQTGVNNALGDLRIYMDFGGQDYLLPNTLQLHEDMEAAGVPHTWVVVDGNHEDAYWMEHLAEYLAWYSEPWPMERANYPLCSLPTAQPQPSPGAVGEIQLTLATGRTGR